MSRMTWVFLPKTRRHSGDVFLFPWYSDSMRTMKILTICMFIVALIALVISGGLFMENRALTMKNSLLEQGIKYRRPELPATLVTTEPVVVATPSTPTSTFRAYLTVIDKIRQGYLGPQTPNANFNAISDAISATGDAELRRLWETTRIEQEHMPSGSWNPEGVGNVAARALARVAELSGFVAPASVPTPPSQPTSRPAPAPALAPRPAPTPKSPVGAVSVPVAQSVRDAMVQYLCDPAKPTCPNSELMPELGALYPRTVQVSTDGRYYKCVNLNETYYNQSRRWLGGNCPTSADLALMQQQVLDFCEKTWPTYTPAPGTELGPCPLEGQTPHLSAFCLNILPTITFGAPFECPIRPTPPPSTSSP